VARIASAGPSASARVEGRPRSSDNGIGSVLSDPE
jgi:hypothetical protein